MKNNKLNYEKNNHTLIKGDHKKSYLHFKNKATLSKNIQQKVFKLISIGPKKTQIDH